jgi:hypothetical protein
VAVPLRADALRSDGGGTAVSARLVWKWWKSSCSRLVRQPASLRVL